jgi:hypothetical protein
MKNTYCFGLAFKNLPVRIKIGVPYVRILFALTLERKLLLNNCTDFRGRIHVLGRHVEGLVDALNVM